MIINVDITPRPHEAFEKMLKRFSKKYKKEEISKQAYSHKYFKSKSQLRRENILKSKRLKEKRNKY